jgi:hypothetical protein
MARLTITLPDHLHERLRYKAARDNKTIGQVIEEELDFAVEGRRQRLREIMDRARANAAKAPAMSEDEVMELAVRLTHEVREEMAAERDSIARNP